MTYDVIPFVLFGSIVAFILMLAMEIKERRKQYRKKADELDRMVEEIKGKGFQR